MGRLHIQDWWTLKKTGPYYVMHISVAAIVAYVITGDLRAAVALSLIEPTVQAVAYYFHEKAWRRAEHGPAPDAGGQPAAPGRRQARP